MYLAEAGLLDINATFWIEVAAFLIMLAVLGRWVYPRVIALTEERQREVAAQLEAAERARQEAEERLQAAQRRLDEARASAQEIISGAGRSAEQLRKEIRERADEEARRIIERAQQDIEVERQRAIDSVRAEVAHLVVEATEKVVGETLDARRHRNLIDQAIAEVGAQRG